MRKLVKSADLGCIVEIENKNLSKEPINLYIKKS